MPQQLLPFWNAFKRWWWLIVISAGLAGFSAYYFSSRQQPIYQATVTLRVGAGIEALDQNAAQFGGTLAESYEKFVRLRPITQAVVEELNLPITPDQLKNQIATRVIGQAQILEITVFAGSPEVAADLANAVGRELIKQTTPAADKAIDREYLQSELARTRAQIDESDARIRELRDQMLTMTSAADLTDAQNRLDGLEKSKQELRIYYLQTADLIASRSSGALSIIVPATPNSSPLGPYPSRDAMLGVIGGILLAVGAIVLLEFADTALRWVDVTLENSLPVLGILPALPRRSSPLILQARSTSAEADAVRSLRTRIFLADSGAMIKRLLITSPTPRDGKSFATVNLALAAADAGLRVVVVDGDIRAGTIHQYFGLEREPGLTNLLWNHSMTPAQSLSLLRRTGTPNLQILAAGTYARDPLMLLRSPRLKHLMDELSERADLIVIDSPPVSAGPITTLLSAVADGIVLVASIDHTNRKLFNQARDELMKSAEAPLLGLALNRVSLGKIGPEIGIYGYGYTYGHVKGPPKTFLARLRALPSAVVGRITHRAALSPNGQQPDKAVEEWLEETPGQPPAGEAALPPPAEPSTAPVRSDTDIMTVAEAAAQLEVPEDAVEEWCRTGQLPAVRIGKRWLVTGLAVAPKPETNGSSGEVPEDYVEHTWDL